jgi:hypothetical protein
MRNGAECGGQPAEAFCDSSSSGSSVASAATTAALTQLAGASSNADIAAALAQFMHGAASST